MQKYCISVDWLQTFCLGNLIEVGEYTTKNHNFKVQMLPYETAQFKHLFKVTEKGLDIATIQQSPRTSVINPKATLVKLENRILYSQQYIEIIYALQEALKLHYKGITRIDLCLDCNEMADGRNVGKFIRQYVSAEPHTIGHIYRKGSDRFSLHGSRTTTSASRLTSIRFGTHNSKIGAYIYDKTLELIEVKDKPWIRQMWKENGLLCEYSEDELNKMTPKEREKKVRRVGLADYVKNQVWRFEISIKAQGTDLVNMGSGELFKLSPRYLEHYQAIERLFFIYAEKAFCFHINTGQKRTRDYPRLKIFEHNHEITSKPIQISRMLDSGRSERTCMNKLEKLSTTYTNLSGDYSKALSDVKKFLKELSGIKRSLLNNQRNIDALNNFRGSIPYGYETECYLASVIELHKSKEYNIEAELLYDIFYGNKLPIIDVHNEIPPSYDWPYFGYY